MNMFDQSKALYMTKTIAQELPTEHLHFIIDYLIKHQPKLTDYLQVFDFYVEQQQQWLVQRQEQPEREATIQVPLKESEPIEQTVWAIDQGTEGVLILFPKDN